MTDAECRAYLLGRMTPAGAERLEARVLEDDELFQAIRSAEDDLYDAFARGQLPPDDRARFLDRFGAAHDRIAFAHALAARRRPTSVTAPRLWFSLAAAATLALAAGAAWWFRSQPSRVAVVPIVAPVATTQPPSTPSTPRGPSGPTVLALLTLSTTRAAGEPQAIVLPAAAAAIDLRVRLNPADRFDRYALELRSPADLVVWRADDRTSSTTQDGDLILAGHVPAAGLADGVYELSVRGGGTDLGYLSVRIMHQP